MGKIFAGKKALVVGGTGGIGRAVAIGLAERGAEVTIHGGSSGERLDNTLRAIGETGARSSGFLFKIEGKDAAEKVLAHSPPPDILVCAWGPFKQGALEDLDENFWREMAEYNLVFPAALVSLALRKMISQNWGRILLFGGTNTDNIRGFLTSAAYSAAKTALGVIAKSAAKSAGKHGVTCNVICPGLTNTEYITEDQLRYNRDKSPDRKPLEAEDIALTALAVLENHGVNGAVIPIDKGVIL